MTGAGKVMSTPNRKLKYARMSQTASFNCNMEKFVRSPPSLSSCSRLEATTCSCCVRNHAVLGPEGIRKKKRTPAMAVSPPQIRNIAFHGATTRFL